MANKKQNNEEFEEIVADLQQNSPTEAELPPRHPIDAKIDAFAKELLQLVINGNGTQIQQWSATFFSNPGSAKATISVKFEV